MTANNRKFLAAFGGWFGGALVSLEVYLIGLNGQWENFSWWVVLFGAVVALKNGAAGLVTLLAKSTPDDDVIDPMREQRRRKLKIENDLREKQLAVANDAVPAPTGMRVTDQIVKTDDVAVFASNEVDDSGGILNRDDAHAPSTIVSTFTLGTGKVLNMDGMLFPKPGQFFTWAWSRLSESRLVGVEPDMVKLVTTALSMCPYDVRIRWMGGLRTYAEQAGLAENPSITRTKRSRHVSGMAVDVEMFDENGNPTDDLRYYAVFDMAMDMAAAKMGVPKEWGGMWTSFTDAPHFQLPRDIYPDKVDFAKLEIEYQQQLQAAA